MRWRDQPLGRRRDIKAASIGVHRPPDQGALDASATSHVDHTIAIQYFEGSPSKHDEGRIDPVAVEGEPDLPYTILIQHEPALNGRWRPTLCGALWYTKPLFNETMIANAGRAGKDRTRQLDLLKEQREAGVGAVASAAR